jgi:prepilin-type N-terminal cleavage/methylation domain-containing protein
MKRLGKHDNRGFTLVELVVVAAILAIVGGAVAGFLAISTRSYRSVSSEVDLQTEAQVAMNQFKTLLMNAEAGVNFSEDEICIYNEKSRYVITWDEDAQRLYYKEEARKKDADSGKYTTEFEESEEDGSLFAEYVDGFSAAVNTSEKAVIVRISLHFTKGDSSYRTNEDVSLRNTVRINEEISSIYDGEASDTVAATYTGIKGSLGTMNFSDETTADAYSVTLSGSEVTIPLSVTILGNGFPSQEYTAVFVDANGNEMQQTSAGSSAGVGSVVIADAETASSLTLKVASKIAPSVSCTIAIDITKTETTPEQPSTPDQPSTEQPSTPEQPTTPEQPSTGDSKLYLSGDTTVNRGGEVRITAKDSLESDAKEYGADEVTWSVSVNNNGSGVTINAGLIKVPKNLDYNTAYTITVTATLKNTKESKTFEVQVPKVSVQYATTKNGTYTDDYVVPMTNLQNGSSITIYYEVTGIEGGSLSEFSWNNYNEIFNENISIDSEKIIIKKSVLKISDQWNTYEINSYWMCGTPSVDGIAIYASVLEANNNTSNISIEGNSYYIPVIETNGWTKLGDTDYWYQISYVTVVVNDYYSYETYKLVVSKNRDLQSGISYKPDYNGLKSPWNTFNFN